MKRLITILFLAAALCGTAFSQHRENPEFARLLREDLSRAGVSTHSYEFDPVSDTKAPRGFKPFYISHYGRHGSRSDWWAEAYAEVRDILEKAKAEGNLTAEGEEFLGETLTVIANHNGMNGRLTPKGAREHEQIARRMFKRYRRVFTRGNHRIRAISSVAPRCIISMTGFTSRLSKLCPKLDFYWDSGETLQKYISSDATPWAWKESEKELKELRDSFNPDTTTILSTLFKDPEAARKDIQSPRGFQERLLHVARTADAFEMTPSPFRHFPFEVVYDFCTYYSVEMYLRQNNSAEYGDNRMPGGKPLVMDIIGKADEVIQKGTYAADLRFGHDYGLMGLVGYLGIEGVGDRLTATEARDVWFGPQRIPFASNLQMIFYRNRKGEVLVKFLYNEKEAYLSGLGSYSGPYYRWEDVKAHTLAKNY